MRSPLFTSQPSNDLSIYLPEIDNQEALQYQSAAALINKFELPTLSSASSHRIDYELFDPINDDNEAVLSLIENESLLKDSYDMDEITYDQYFIPPSQVVPHFPNFESEPRFIDIKPASPPLKSSNNSHKKNSSSPIPFRNGNCTDLKRFLVHDGTTGRLRRPLLYEFIRILLEYEEYSYMATYIDAKKGIFKLEKPDDVAELWKSVKGRNSDNGK